VAEGFVLSPFLFAVVFSPVLAELEATGFGVEVGGAWLGALLYMDDVALLAPSYEDLSALAEVLWAWCWRFRWVPYPGQPKTYVFVLGPGAAADAYDYGGRFSFVFTPAREAARLARGAPRPWRSARISLSVARWSTTVPSGTAWSDGTAPTARAHRMRRASSTRSRTLPMSDVSTTPR